MKATLYPNAKRTQKQNRGNSILACVRWKVGLSRREGIVKSLVYKQILVGCLMLISACQDPNHYKKDDLRHVRDFADQRQAEAVLEFFNHPDVDVRAEAALVFGSMHDSSAVEGLLHLAEFDDSEQVRRNAAFALGQYKMPGLRNLLVRLMQEEQDDYVRHELTMAVGKSQGGAILSSRMEAANDQLVEEFSEGVFFSVVQGEDLPVTYFIPSLKGSETAAYYSAAALARLGKPLDSLAQILREIYPKHKNDLAQLPLAFCLGKAETDLPTMRNHFESESNYLVRLNLLRGNAGKSADLLYLALSDSIVHVREAAAGLLLKCDSTCLSDSICLAFSAKEKSPRTKYLLMEAALKRAETVDRKIRISQQLSLDFERVQDDYVQGFILKALMGWEANRSFVQNKSFGSESILVRGAGVEALIEAQKLAQQPIISAFTDCIQRGLKTKDVAVSALCANAMRDTSIYRSVDLNEDIRLVEEAMQAMRLPRDIETYSELFSTFRFLRGETPTGSLKPEMNHRIDWELGLRIRDNQEISIQTERGEIICELWTNRAVGTVSYFVTLIRDSFYVNKRIHRVVPGFVIQDGCPRGDGYGSTMQTIRSEFHPDARFEEGTLGMASSGEDTESCQWFITHTKTPHLDGRYTAFGRVTQGLDVLHALQIGDRIHRIQLLP